MIDEIQNVTNVKDEDTIKVGRVGNHGYEAKVDELRTEYEQLYNQILNMEAMQQDDNKGLLKEMIDDYREMKELGFDYDMYRSNKEDMERFAGRFNERKVESDVLRKDNNAKITRIEELTVERDNNFLALQDAIQTINNINQSLDNEKALRQHAEQRLNNTVQLLDDTVQRLNDTVQRLHDTVQRLNAEEAAHQQTMQRLSGEIALRQQAEQDRDAERVLRQQAEQDRDAERALRQQAEQDRDAERVLRQQAEQELSAANDLHEVVERQPTRDLNRSVQKHQGISISAGMLSVAAFVAAPITVFPTLVGIGIVGGYSALTTLKFIDSIALGRVDYMYAVNPIALPGSHPEIQVNRNNR